MLDWLAFSATLDAEGYCYRLGFAERHIGNEFIRALHGGVISSFLQTCAMAELVGRMEETAILRPISVHCDFLRPARDMDMSARATIVRTGRRVTFLDVLGWQEDAAKPVGKAAIAIRTLDGGTR